MTSSTSQSRSISGRRGSTGSLSCVSTGQRRRSSVAGGLSGKRLTEAAVVVFLVVLFLGGTQQVDSLTLHDSLKIDTLSPQLKSEGHTAENDSSEHYLAPKPDDDGKIRIRRKVTSGGKPATCTCTCETALIAVAAASTSGKPGEEKNVGKDATMPVQLQQPISLRYGYRQPQQLGGPEKDDIVSADEPTKMAASGSGNPSSSSLDSDYDEALGINYGKQSQQSRNKVTSEQIIHDVDSIDSRHPWLQLPDRMCFREPCSSDRDCCRRYNICDRSANVCTDCWYGNPCMSPRDCCQKYPHCQRPAGTAPTSSTSSSAAGPIGGEQVGKCVDISK